MIKRTREGAMDERVVTSTSTLKNKLTTLSQCPMHTPHNCLLFIPRYPVQHRVREHRIHRLRNSERGSIAVRKRDTRMCHTGNSQQLF